MERPVGAGAEDVARDRSFASLRVRERASGQPSARCSFEKSLAEVQDAAARADASETET
jgi:hypothetical protein